MRAPRFALVLAGASFAAACVRAPDPYWVTDPSLTGPYPPGQTLPGTLAHAPPSVLALDEAAHGPSINAPAPLPPAPAVSPPLPLVSASAATSQPAGAEPASAPVSSPAAAPQPFQAPIPPIVASSPAIRYANLSPAACKKELGSRKLPITHEKKAVRNIANALRVTGDLNGVRVISAPSPSPFGLLDCRLALALDDLTKLLASHGIVQIYIGSMYRQGARIAHRGNKSQHSYGLAMDILSLRHRDGRLLKVERDWHAGIGETSCGTEAVMHDPDPSSVLLRNVVCEVARAHIFHHMLTPGANAAHRDHFHFDLKRDANYQSVR